MYALNQKLYMEYNQPSAEPDSPILSEILRLCDDWWEVSRISNVSKLHVTT